MTLEAKFEERDGVLTVRLAKELDTTAKGAMESLARSLAKPAKDRSEVILDVSGVKTLGGVSLTNLRNLTSTLRERGFAVRIRAGDEAQRQRIRSQGRSFVAPDPNADGGPDVFERLGDRTLRLRDAAIRYSVLLTATSREALAIVLFRRRNRGALVLASILQMGSRAVPLVVLIAALIGIILALHSAPLLRLYGQELRVADLVGLAMTKEIAPLLTAILVAGRSGSSLAAEIGTMKVSEEVDALEVMGVSPVGYLVAPRLLALILALPALTILADVVGIAGGLFIGVSELQLSKEAYLQQTLLAIKLKDIMGGLLKAVAFAIAMVSISAHQGFSTAGGAAGVGKYTTRSVVRSIIWIIILDAIFTAILYAMD